MFGFLTLGTTMTLTDLAIKTKIDGQNDEVFPRDLEGTKGRVKLYKSHNDGFAFGFLRGTKIVKMIPLCFISGIAGIWTYVMSRKGKLVEKIALTLVLAGGASNLIDRLTRGYVVDYLGIQWKALKNMVFNLADIWIIAGSVLLILKNSLIPERGIKKKTRM